jgi:hypothetical protein
MISAFRKPTDGFARDNAWMEDFGARTQDKHAQELKTVAQTRALAGDAAQREL